MNNDESVITVSYDAHGLKIGANLSKREYFAALAMQAYIIANTNNLSELSFDVLTKESFRVADSMLNQAGSQDD